MSRNCGKVHNFLDPPPPTLASDVTLNFGTVCPILKIPRAKQVIGLSMVCGISLRVAYIANLSLLQSLEPFEKGSKI